jgi:hypothetical protein
LNHKVSETEYCLHLQVEPTQLGPMGRVSLCLWTPATLSTFHRKTEIEPVSETLFK